MDGGGAVKGMTEEEQMWLAQFTTHTDAEGMSGNIDTDLKDAVEYESTNDPINIDGRRQEIVADLTLQARRFADECEA